jgi:hypothetical protein
MAAFSSLLCGQVTQKPGFSGANRPHFEANLGSLAKKALLHGPFPLELSDIFSKSLRPILASIDILTAPKEASIDGISCAVYKPGATRNPDRMLRSGSSGTSA